MVRQSSRKGVRSNIRVSRVFRGGLAAAKEAQAELLVDAAKGCHTGTPATVNNLFDDWLIELRTKGHSPNTVHGYEKVYRHNIAPTLGSVPVTKVTTKMLTDLYGAHQERGLAPGSVYQVHACVSSMMTQACRWGWRDSNPAQWADPPSIPNNEPVVPTPSEVTSLLRAAEESRRPEMASAPEEIAASTGSARSVGMRCRDRVALGADHGPTASLPVRVGWRHLVLGSFRIGDARR